MTVANEADWRTLRTWLADAAGNDVSDQAAWGAFLRIEGAFRGACSGCGGKTYDGLCGKCAYEATHNQRPSAP